VGFETVRQVLSAIPEFVLLLVTSIAGYVTSGIVMATIWIWEHKHARNLSWKACKWILLAFLLASCFSVWYSSRPGLKAVIEMKGSGNLTGFSVPVTFLVVQVRNSGVPSVATSWNLTVIDAVGKKHHGRPEAIMRTLSNGQTQSYSPQDALYEKGVRHGISQGDLITGILLYSFSDIDLQSLKRQENKFVLSFQDISGRQHIAQDDATEFSNEQWTYPGLGDR
jgi:hypothetical protein